MTNILPLWTSVREDEPAHGVLVRLAEINGFRARSRMLTATGLRVARLRMGHDLDRLAAILKCSPSAFESSTPKALGSSRIEIRGERFSLKNYVNRASRRVCPDCVAESAYQRFWWDFSFLTCCPSHRTWLSAACTCGRLLSWADTRINGCRLCSDGTARRLPDTVPENVVEMERWALGRLGVGPSPIAIPFVGEMPLMAAVDTLRRIGTLDMGGYRKSIVEPENFGQRECVRARGFEILLSDGFDDLLDRVYAKFLVESGTSNPSLSVAYGWFSHWYWSRKRRDPLSELGKALVANASRKFQLKSGAYSRADMGKPPPNLTLHEAARAIGRAHGTLRKILLPAGRIRPEKNRGRPLGINSEHLDEVAEALADSVPLSAIPAILGVGIHSVEILAKAEMLPFSFDRSTESRKLRGMVRRLKLEAWVEELIGDPPVVPEKPSGTFLLSEACLKANVPIAVLIESIRDGRVPVIGRLRDKPLFAGAVLPKDSVTAVRPPEVTAKIAHWKGKRVQRKWAMRKRVDRSTPG